MSVPNRSRAGAPVRSVLALDVVDSTNAEALRRAGAGARGPLWITARTQSAGRGRRGRPWTSPAGNLHATLMLCDPAPPTAAAQLGFVAGIAVHDAAVAQAPRLAGRLKLKWPNDLLCAGRKIAGVLIEGEGAPLAVAVGIGVNCRHHPDTVEFHAATDFATEGCDVGAEALFDDLAGAMAARLREWDRGAGFAGIRTAWLERASGIGDHVEVRLDGTVTAGRFETIDAAGRLILRTPGGVVAVAAGDVFALDPARRTP